MRISDWSSDVCSSDLPGPYFHQYGTDIRETHCEIDYHAPARLDELITIAARISRFGRTSITLHCGIFRDAERLTDIEISYAHVDSESGQPTPLQGPFKIGRAWLRERERQNGKIK